MIISCDVDGVLHDFITQLCRRARLPYVPEDFRAWDLCETLTRQETSDAFRHMSYRGFVRDMEEYPGAPEFVRALKERGRLVLVSSPSGPRWAKERWARMDMYSPYARILDTDRALAPGDILIDDRADNVVRWTEAHPEGFGIVLARPWNHDPDHPRITRCDDYSHVLSHIDSVKGWISE